MTAGKPREAQVGDVYRMTYYDGSTSEEVVMAIDEHVHTYEDDGDVWQWELREFPTRLMTFLRHGPIDAFIEAAWIKRFIRINGRKPPGAK